MPDNVNGGYCFKLNSMLQCFTPVWKSHFQYLIDRNTFNLRAIKTSDAITEIKETVVIDVMMLLKASKYTTKKDSFINEVKNYKLNGEVPERLSSLE